MISRLIFQLAFLAGIAHALPAVATEPVAGDDLAPAPPLYQSTNLLPAAVDALRRKVLVQCGLDGPDSHLLPWYFHFEYGRALLEAGDARRAIEELSQSIDLRPEPRARKRTYGMWFLDYLPYFQLAEAHAMLANWPCAERAMQLSRSTGEIELGRIEAQRIRLLQERIDRHVDDIGSCNLRDYQDSTDGDAGFDQ